VPDVVEFMKKRKSDPLVYEKDGFQWIKMGDWHRRILPKHMDVPAKIADMDINDINITALSINDPGPEWFEEDGPEVAFMMNNFIAGVVRQNPERFIGLCVLSLQDPQAAEKELKRCITDLGMRGILLYTNLAGSWPDEQKYRWLFAHAATHDIPILLHPAKPSTTEQVKGYNLTSLMGNMFENTIALARIIASGLLDEYPQLKLVCPHLGGTLPYIAGRFDHQVAVLKRSNQNLKHKPSEYLRRIYMDIVSPLPQAIKFAVEFSGPEHLLFASDHPWVDPHLIKECLTSLHLPAEDEDKIIGRNAQELFNL
jgi:predicted TIM-barrel fold metal-dependent hydrolase